MDHGNQHRHLRTLGIRGEDLCPAEQYPDGIIIFWCSWRITKDRVVAAFAGGFFLVAVFFAAMATLAIPDSYLFLFWSLTLWLTIEATRGERPFLWIAVGAALGLCMLAKFHGILLALSILSYLLISGRQRKHYRSAWLYLGMFVAALLFRSRNAFLLQAAR